MNTKVEEYANDAGLLPVEEVAVHVSRRGEEGQVVHYPPAVEYVTLATAHKRMAAMNTEIVRGHALATGYEEALTRAEVRIAQQDATIARLTELVRAVTIGDYVTYCADVSTGNWFDARTALIAALNQEQGK